MLLFKTENNSVSLINSGKYSGKNVNECIPLIQAELNSRSLGKYSKVLHIKAINISFDE